MSPETKLIPTDPAERLEVEVLIDGEDFEWAVPAEECSHDGDVSVFPFAAKVLDVAGRIDHWDLRVRVRCSGCGAMLSVDPSARLPKQPPGVVLTVRRPGWADA